MRGGGEGREGARKGKLNGEPRNRFTGVVGDSVDRKKDRGISVRLEPAYREFRGERGGRRKDYAENSFDFELSLRYASRLVRLSHFDGFNRVLYMCALLMVKLAHAQILGH